LNEKNGGPKAPKKNLEKSPRSDNKDQKKEGSSKKLFSKAFDKIK